MIATRSRKLFVNLPVRDLRRSVAFFKELGFRFEPHFGDDTSACMVLSDEGYAMLLAEPRFQGVARKPLADARASTSALFALTADSREEVDTLVQTALASGGARAADPVDHGFMYGSSFYDPDGHHWEIFYVDPSAIPP